MFSRPAHGKKYPSRNALATVASVSYAWQGFVCVWTWLLMCGATWVDSLIIYTTGVRTLLLQSQGSHIQQSRPPARSSWLSQTSGSVLLIELLRLLLKTHAEVSAIPRMQLPGPSADPSRTHQQTASHLIWSTVSELSERARYLMGISMNDPVKPSGVEVPSLSRVSQSTAVLDWSKSNNVGEVAIFIDNRKVGIWYEKCEPLWSSLKPMRTSFHGSLIALSRGRLGGRFELQLAGRRDWRSAGLLLNQGRRMSCYPLADVDCAKIWLHATYSYSADATPVWLEIRSSWRSNAERSHSPTPAALPHRRSSVKWSSRRRFIIVECLLKVVSARLACFASCIPISVHWVYKSVWQPCQVSTHCGACPIPRG